MLFRSRALALLSEAGYSIKDGILAKASGERLAFEILVKDRADERLSLAYAQSLARIGVNADVRLVDEVQYQRRRTKFDFDMMIASWLASPSPGGEQRGRWGSAAASMDGAYNVCGAHLPAIDAMIGALLSAQSRDEFVGAVRALDRILLSNYYIVPLFYAPEQWIAWSAKLGRPEKTPLFGVTIDAWWSQSP